MNDTLKYVPVEPGMKGFDEIEELYNTAFPPEERPFPMEKAVRFALAQGGVEMSAVYDGEALVGFYVVTFTDYYKYLQFIAVNPKIRSKGYGGRILTKLLEENKDTVFFGSIERPDPDGENYDIKLKRQQFYERNGMITVDRRRIAGGVEFIIVTNKTGEQFDRCYENEVREEAKQFEAANRKG